MVRKVGGKGLFPKSVSIYEYIQNECCAQKTLEKRIQRDRRMDHRDAMQTSGLGRLPV